MKDEKLIKTDSLDFSGYAEAEIMNAIISVASNSNMPFAIWRKPQENEISIAASFSPSLPLTKIDLEILDEGFLFAPFSYPNNPSQFIKADVKFTFDFDEAVTNLKSDQSSNDQKAFVRNLNEALERKDPARFHTQEPSNGIQSNYVQLIEKAIEGINAGDFDKVVPARSKQLEVKGGLDVLRLFKNLCSTYENAFVSLVSIPEQGTWLGATPEVLIEQTEDTFKTVALAGTQAFDEAKSLGETAWTQKEIEEQAMVSRFIINCFKKIRLREFIERGPKTSKAGNLLHLKTTYEVDLKATNFAELGTVMLDLLHPTSAVAGMPKQEALDFIRAHEGLDRKYYSGFLGPVKVEDSTNLFVNLRCMELHEDSITLYAGAGVTSDSVPSKELEETEMKFRTLLNLLDTAI